MAAIGNGMAAYGGIIPYTATFLVFVTYSFPAVRLSALANHQQLYIMTHDSIGLGEDGPTHQPVESLALCRSLPNCLVLRPADGNEVSGAYAAALLHRHGPSVLALTRQACPHQAGSSIAAVQQGAYTLATIGAAGKPNLILLASGSEVALARAAAQLLVAAGGNAPASIRLVSAPCLELFDQQPMAYRREVLTPSVPVVSVEALSVYGWARYAHIQLGMRSFGASAPGPALMDRFGFTPAKVAASVTLALGQHAADCATTGLPATFGLLPVHTDRAAKL